MDRLGALAPAQAARQALTLAVYDAAHHEYAGEQQIAARDVGRAVEPMFDECAGDPRVRAFCKRKP